MADITSNSINKKRSFSKRESVARGTAFLLLAQAIFLINSYIMHVFLARLLGPSYYGLWGVIHSILVWVELILAAGVPMVLTKLYTDEKYSQESVYKNSLWLQLTVSIIMFVTLFLFSPMLGFLLNDASLVFYLRIAFIDIPFFGLLYLFYSVLRGNKLFLKLSTGIIIYTTVKTIAIVSLVLAGFSLVGALAGSISASIVAMIFTFFFMEIDKTHFVDKHVSKSKILKLVPYFIMFSLTSQFITHIDLWSVKSILRNNIITGYYNAASVISQAPGFVLLALSITLFPAVNNAIAKKDFKLANRYLIQAVRLICFLSFPLYSLFVASSRQLITFVFSKKFLPAWSIFDILLIGFILVIFIEVISTLMLALNDFKLLTFLMLSLSLLSFILNIILIPIFKAHGAAASTTITVFIGVILGVFYFRNYKMKIPVPSIVKMLLASLIIFPVVQILAGDGLMLIPAYILGGIIYLLLLLLFREITMKDWLLAQEILGIKKRDD